MKRGFWTGLVLLTSIYTILYLFFYEAPYYQEINRTTRHIIRLLILVGVYLLGSYHLRLEKFKWGLACWHLVHITGILIILSIGIIHWLFTPVTLFWISLSVKINEFLVAPIFYIAMNLLKSLKKTN